MESLRVSSLAVCVMIICGGLVASASAAEFEVEGTAPVTVLGKQVGGEAPVFTLDGSKVECEKVEFEGTMAGISQTTLEVVPKYSSCKAFGFLEATVSMNGCKYKFLQPTGSGPFSGQMSIVCPEGTIKIVAATCEVQIGAQGPLSGTVTHEDLGTTPIRLGTKAALEKLTYNRTKDGFGCPLTGTGVKEDGKYSGGAEFEGSQAGAVAFGVTFAWLSANPKEVEFPTEIEVTKSDKKPLEISFIGKIRNSVNILDARIVNTSGGNHFKIVNNGCKKGKLVKGTPCKLEVEFAPEKKGALTAEVIVEEDRVFGRTFQVPVKGTGK
jgi:hypothetical protein